MEPSTMKLRQRPGCPGKRAVERWMRQDLDLYPWLRVSDLVKPARDTAYTNGPSTLVLSITMTHTDDDAYMAFICGEVATHFQATGLEWAHQGNRWAARIWWQ